MKTDLSTQPTNHNSHILSQLITWLPRVSQYSD